MEKIVGQGHPAVIAPVGGDPHEVYDVDDLISVDVVFVLVVRGGGIVIRVLIDLRGAPAHGDLDDVTDVHSAIAVHVPKEAAAVDRSKRTGGPRWGKDSGSRASPRRRLGLRESGGRPGETDQRDTEYDSRCDQSETNTRFHNVPLSNHSCWYLSMALWGLTTGRNAAHGWLAAPTKNQLRDPCFFRQNLQPGTYEAQYGRGLPGCQVTDDTG